MQVDSPVATTVTHFLRVVSSSLRAASTLAPRVPCSPTSPITTTSASVPRAIIPSNVLLPTPEACKNTDALSASQSQQTINGPDACRQDTVDGGRCMAVIGGASRGTLPMVAIGPKSSIGEPEASITRPIIAVPRGVWQLNHAIQPCRQEQFLPIHRAKPTR